MRVHEVAHIAAENIEDLPGDQGQMIGIFGRWVIADHYLGAGRRAFDYYPRLIRLNFNSP